MFKKGQSSVEFIILFGFVFFIFILVLGAVVHYTILHQRDRDYVELEDLASMIRREVEIAFHVNDGYVREFEIPLKLGINDYSMNVSNNDLTLGIGDREFSCILPEFTGNLTKGKNIISRSGGVVYVNV